MAAVNFVDDLVNAAIALVVANSAVFGLSLGEDTDESAPKIEYARDGLAGYVEGVGGTCKVYPEESAPADLAQLYTGSAWGSWVLTMEFDLIESKEKAKVKSRVMQAMQTLFGDRGAQFFASLTDAGSNRLGGSGVLSLGEIIEGSPGRGPANVKLTARLEVGCWHVQPLVYNV
jgi:hypothetical protein